MITRTIPKFEDCSGHFKPGLLRETHWYWIMVFKDKKKLCFASPERSRPKNLSSKCRACIQQALDEGLPQGRHLQSSLKKAIVLNWV
ncbi:hypothetical protein J4Q44_G00134250 [Coregonus suidteri]|uniref:Uncharacterized protein n=1 Tax=Coregonus suidteri TaxID=861788 RepID=A0AAN8MBQ5_9TELE